MASAYPSLSAVFERLTDPKSKLKALDELLGNLTLDEIRFLQAKISTVDFHSDPVDKLPFELCYHIFQHLEIYQIFQAQRVSRKWFHVLSSPKMLEPLILRPWYEKSELSSRTLEGHFQGALSLSKGLASGKKTSIQARHIDSFKNGTPFSMAAGRWQQPAQNADIYCHIAFAGSILAWADPEAGYILLKCLVSGQDVRLSTPAQEEIRQISISDTAIVALTFSGKACAWDFSSGLRCLVGQSPECIETRIETHVDGNQTDISVSQGVVVALHCVNKKTVNFTTWDTNGGQLHRFRRLLNRGAPLEPFSFFAIVPPCGKSLVFFERVFDKTKPKHVLFTRMNLKGQVESSGCIEHPDIEGYSKNSEKVIPAYTADCITLWSYARSRHLAHKLEILRVVYHTKTNRLDVQRSVVEHVIQTTVSAGDFFWWKDVAYFKNSTDGLEEYEVLDLKASVCKKAEMSVLNPSPETLTREHDCCLLGNESFLISVRLDSYTAWCFENIKLAAEDDEYRPRMRAKKRLLKEFASLSMLTDLPFE